MHTLDLSLTEDVSSLGQSRAPMVVVMVAAGGLVFPEAVARGQRAQDRCCYC